ncbi:MULTISPECIES: cell division protein CdvB3 [Metallosphaera]|uniref:Uncharacterized protein n=1 Tax=Metallosphaera cuprina (strain Ar-4) TaxID=1006006 RepID=F4FZB4_METCR|nr:cell division protein CdvB3 [Metallosphaera cuprina]AEB94423.1 conserved hypothetical protein [Metallosphaera cuprina Ar-4]
MKRGLQRLLVEVKTARGKLRLWQNRLTAKAEQFRRLSVSNASRFSTLAQQYAKESEQLESIITFLNKFDVILEMLELKLETIVFIDYISQDLVNIVEALKEFKRTTPMLGTELSLLVDEIYTGFYASVEVPEPIKIKAKEEAKVILQQSEDVLKERKEKLSTKT